MERGEVEVYKGRESVGLGVMKVTMQS